MPDKLLIDLFSAYFTARKNKRNSRDALEFEINYEHNLFKLYQDLKNGSYYPDKSIAFIVSYPVKREIIASSFRDRVIHHLIFNYINPIFDPSFINDSYSCRRGRGTSYGIKRLQHFIRSCSDNYNQDCYILKLDLSGYFMSVNRKILYEKIEKKLFKEKNNINFDINLVLDLIKKIIFKDYTSNCIIYNDFKDWQGLPKNKSLFFVDSSLGLPIGNLTSQLFSNIYLNEFDHFIKRTLKFNYYGRYVDDFVIVDNNKEKLKKSIPIIKEYLIKHLELKLHPKKIYLQSFNKGVDFLGVVIKPYICLCRNRIKYNIYKTIEQINKSLETQHISEIKFKKIISQINSYLGFLNQVKGCNLKKNIFKKKLRLSFLSFFYYNRNCEKVFVGFCFNKKYNLFLYEINK